MKSEPGRSTVMTSLAAEPGIGAAVSATVAASGAAGRRCCACRVRRGIYDQRGCAGCGRPEKIAAVDGVVLGFSHGTTPWLMPEEYSGTRIFCIIDFVEDFGERPHFRACWRER